MALKNMEARSLQSIRLEIYRRFPAMRGVRPRLQAIRPPTAPGPGRPAYVLVFESQGQAQGRRIPLIVRVLVDARGKILRITTSR